MYLVCVADSFPQLLNQLNIEGSIHNAPWIAARRWEEESSYRVPSNEA